MFLKKIPPERNLEALLAGFDALPTLVSDTALEMPRSSPPETTVTEDGAEAET